MFIDVSWDCASAKLVVAKSGDVCEPGKISRDPAVQAACVGIFADAGC